MKTLLLSFSVLLFLLGCQSPQGPVIARVHRVPWPDEEYSRLKLSGNNTVSGQAFMKTRGGDVKTCAGEDVFLSPVTTYSSQFFNLEVMGKREQFQSLDPEDPRVWNYIKKVKADASGRFTFYDVAPGEYFLYTLVRWEAPTGYGLSLQGGFLGSRIVVQDGQRSENILSK